ncbi:hypothetical protein V6N13_147428 [Hibiscus sabdariffa]
MLVLLFLLYLASLDINQDGFSFNGYLNVDGVAEVDSSGLFKLTDTGVGTTGHIFYRNPLQFKNSTNASVSTTFIFAIVPESIGGHGLAFVISPTDEIPRAYPAQYLVELDTFCNMEYHDIDDNHVGIDINSLVSVKSASAGYFTDEGKLKNVSLPSGDPMQIWIEYDGVDKQLNVTLHPINIPKPQTPLLCLKRDLSPYMYETMYVGFSSSSSSHSTMRSSHYILAWSFKMNGEADELDLSRLPKVPRHDNRGIKQLQRILIISLSLTGLTLVLVMVFGAMLLSRKRRFIEILEDWEVKGSVLDVGFKAKDEAVSSEQFVVSKLWNHAALQRPGVVSSAVPSAEQQPVSSQPAVSSAEAGTLGYMAPELARTGKANTSMDVYAFGTFMLEVACGRRPIEERASPDQTFLADWITNCWDDGDILAAVDGRLEKRFVVQEAELVLKLGLLCSHPVAAARPSMSSVISYLEGVAALPDNLSSVIKTREFHVESSDELITESNYSVPPLTIT